MRTQLLGLMATLGVLACSSEGTGTNDDPSSTSGGAGGADPGSGGAMASGGAAIGAGGSPATTGGAAPGSGGAAPGAGGAAPGTGGAPAGCVPTLDCTLDPPPTTGDPAQDCVDRINQFRTECACLEPLERWTEGEACADRMAEYDSERDTAHAGFRDGICEGGSGQNECPGTSSIDRVVSRCLQGMWSEGPPTIDPCEDDCFQEHGHYLNMTNPRNSRVACGFFTTASGEVWAVQNFSR